MSALIGSASEGRVAMVKLLCGKQVTDLNVKDNVSIVHPNLLAMSSGFLVVVLIFGSSHNVLCVVYVGWSRCSVLCRATSADDFCRY